MLIDEDLKVFIALDMPNNTQKVAVVQRYILDKKNQEIKINMPMDLMNLQLMEIAFQIAKEYYINIFK